MKEKAIDYFEKYKRTMSEGEIVRALQKEGVDEHTIEEAREIVFGLAVSGPTPAEHESFWNFYDKKVYSENSQKWKDFCLGLFGLAIPLYICVAIDHFIGFIFAWAFFTLLIFCIFYFWQRRRFISFGNIIATIFVPALLFIAFLWYWV
jgi:hypothetical protein